MAGAVEGRPGAATYGPAESPVRAEPFDTIELDLNRIWSTPEPAAAGKEPEDE